MSEIKLKVDEARKSDVGKQIARIPTPVADKLGVKTGDVVQIKGVTTTYSKVWRSSLNSINSDIIKIDSLTRKNAGVNLDDMVMISAYNVTMCNKIKLKSLQQINTSEDFLPYLHKGILEKIGAIDNIISINTGFGGLIYLKIVDIDPKTASIISKSTKISLDSDFDEGKEIEDFENKLNDIQIPKVSYEDIGGLGDVIKKIREMIELPLRYPELFDKLGIQPPKGVLLFGPPGTGKTRLAKAIANETSSFFKHLSGPEIMSKYYGEAENKLREIFDEARSNAPSIIFIDEIDALAPKRESSSGEVEKRIVAQLLTLMDGVTSRGNVVIIGATNRPNNIDPALRRGGRFDREIEIGIPDYKSRLEVINIHTRGMPLNDDVNLELLADKTQGYVGSDITTLTKEAALIGLRRLLPSIDFSSKSDLSPEILEKVEIRMSDFDGALREVSPSSLRDVLIEIPEVKWSDIGGMEEIKSQLIESLEWPQKYSELYTKLKIQNSKGILLHGPPGTGKTLLAKAVAGEINANFISIKGPELLSKWLGESEKGIREIFRKARSAAPCIIFFDEFDSIAVHRSNMGDENVISRIVSQLLTELDGLEETKGVVILAATNRPDIIDTAILRPGRIDKIILVGLPDETTREKILDVKLKDLPISDNINISDIIKNTVGYSAAEVSQLVEIAKINAIKELVKKNKSATSKSKIKIRYEDFIQAYKSMDLSKKREYKLKPKDYYEIGSIGIE